MSFIYNGKRIIRIPEPNNEAICKQCIFIAEDCISCEFPILSLHRECLIFGKNLTYQSYLYVYEINTKLNTKILIL